MLLTPGLGTLRLICFKEGSEIFSHRTHAPGHIVDMSSDRGSKKRDFIVLLRRPLTGFVAVDGRFPRGRPGVGSLLPLAVHAPAVAGGAVALVYGASGR